MAEAGAHAPEQQTMVATGEEQPAERSHREILVVMSGLMIALLLAMLDNMIVAPALPTIVGELGGLQHLAWVTTAYILGTAVGTPIWGKLGDLFSRKTIFMTSIIIFLIGSALCGAAQSMNELIAFRALQGIGAGGLMVSVMSVLAVLVAPRDRGKYTGYFMAIMPIAMVGGPLIGGFITDHASWRWAFYVNLPLGAVALAVIAVTMHLPTAPKRKVKLDWLGTALMTTWITALVLVTSWGGTQYAWGSPTILGLIALTLVTFVAFLLVERRAAEPIMPLGVFGNLNFTLSVALSFVVGFAMYGGMTFLPQFQQFVQGQSATNSGLLLLPLMVGLLVTSTGSGQAVSRTGRYKAFPILGTIFMTAGLALLATMDVGTSTFTAGVYMFVMGLGMGCLMQITMLVAQNSVPMKDIGAATAASTFLRSMGGSIGVSILGALYAHRLQNTLHDRLGEGAAQLGNGTQLTPTMVRKLPGNVVDAFRQAIADGNSAVFLWAAIISVSGIVVAFFIKEVPLRGSAPKPLAKPAAEAALALPEAAAVPVTAAVLAAVDEPAAVDDPAPVAESAPVPVQAQSETPEPTGPLVHGQVREADGTALDTAVLTLLDGGGREAGHARTDGFGDFLLRAPTAGDFVLVVSAQGFLPFARPVRAGAVPGGLDLTLAALEARLTGVVLDAAGAPVVGAMVALTDLDGALRARSSTRAEGHYALAGLDAGGYTLTVIAAGHVPGAVAVTVPDEGCGIGDVELVLDGVAAPSPRPAPSYS
jgi:EmrB/QacA subfamily drug resistance transporter